MSIKNIYVSKRYIDDDFFINKDTSFYFGGNSSTDLSNYFNKDEIINNYLNITGGTLTGDLNVNGNVIATGDIMAYSDSGEIGSIWDDMPVATETTLGGVKVDASISDIYLDANNVLQVDIGNVGLWDNITNGIEYTGGNVIIEKDSSGESTGYNTNSILRLENNTDLFIETKSPQSSYAGIYFTDNTSKAGGIIYGHNTSSNANILGLGAWVGISFRVSAANGVFEKTERMYLNNTGLEVNGTVTATNFILSSDIRLKENINKLNDSTDIISFNFKNDNEKRKRYGIIAQEIEKNNPELVYNNKEGYKQVAYIDYLLMKMAEKDKQINNLESKIEKIEKII